VTHAPIAQSVEHSANNARVLGSIPNGSIFKFPLSLLQSPQMASSTNFLQEFAFIVLLINGIQRYA
jgi:hypothetical protein